MFMYTMVSPCHFKLLWSFRDKSHFSITWTDYLKVKYVFGIGKMGHYNEMNNFVFHQQSFFFNCIEKLKHKLVSLLSEQIFWYTILIWWVPKRLVSNIGSAFTNNKKYLKVSDNSFLLRNKNKKLNKVKLFNRCFLVESFHNLGFIDHSSLLWKEKLRN